MANTGVPKMAWWIYKCNSANHPHQVAWGDWADFFASKDTTEWGSTEWVPRLSELSPGDMVIAYQTDRNELVGVTRVDGFRKRGRHLDLYLEPIEEIGTRVRPLKKANEKIAAIPALMPGPIKTVYTITALQAQTLLRAARKAKQTLPADKIR